MSNTAYQPYEVNFIMNRLEESTIELDLWHLQDLISDDPKFKRCYSYKHLLERLCKIFGISIEDMCICVFLCNRANQVLTLRFIICDYMNMLAKLNGSIEVK